jgi:soluble lytic murein transglycosylase-like protein
MNYLVSLFLILSSFTPQVSAVVHTNVRAVSFPAPLLIQENDLSAVRRLDSVGRGADGKLPQLSAEEHLRRGSIYLANRAFSEAREHFQALIERYPNDVSVPAALYGIGRSYFQMRGYEESVPFFERLVRDFPQTKDGREGLYSLASAFLRLGRASEAAARYAEYTTRYPSGEKIDFAYLNVIDSLREAGRPREAILWIGTTRERFAGTAVATNALFARLRLDVAAGDWTHAIQTADELRSAPFSKKVMTSPDEVLYLKAYSLEHAGRTQEALNVYMTIPDRADSYYGALATTRLLAINDPARREAVNARTERFNAQIKSAARLYPVPYRETILREANKRRIDPRLVLAIMQQESNFRPRIKSNAAARGLLQLTIDTAAKYAAHVGLNNLRDDDLYRPETSILLGSEYIADLARMFPDLPEAVVASYNGGEDNVARWVARAHSNDPDRYVLEIGFSQSKDYVAKVLPNYWTYQMLYNEQLQRR